MSRLDETILELKERVYREQAGVCYHCGVGMEFGLYGSGFELAHLIPQRGWCVALWGKEVIHHRMNVVGTHKGYCNARAQMDPNSVCAKHHATRIREVIRGEVRV